MNKKTKHIQLWIGIGLVVVLSSQFSALGSKAFASEIILKTEPAILTVESAPNGDTQTPFTLTNQGEETIDIRIVLKSFKAADEKGGIEFLSPQIATSSADDAFLRYVQIVDQGVSVTHLTLSPKQQKKLVLHVNPPEDALEIDHYFSVVLLYSPPQPNPNNNESLSVVQPGVAIPILLSIGAKDPGKSFLDSFTAPLFIQAGPMPFTVTLANRGQHFVSAKGVILITNMFGQTVGRITVPNINVLSGTNRQEQFVWKEKVLLGFYKAQVSLALSPQGPLVNKTIYFAAFPMIFIVGTTLTVIFIGLIITTIRRRLSEE